MPPKRARSRSPQPRRRSGSPSRPGMTSYINTSTDLGTNRYGVSAPRSRDEVSRSRRSRSPRRRRGGSPQSRSRRRSLSPSSRPMVDPSQDLGPPGLPPPVPGHHPIPPPPGMAPLPPPVPNFVVPPPGLASNSVFSVSFLIRDH